MSDLSSFLFNINISAASPEPGSLLVAEPFLRESYFNHAVICLIDHGPGHATMGVVLNKLSGHYLGELVEGISEKVEVPVFCGGPMSCDRLFFLHTLGDTIIPGAREINGGLWIGGDFEAMKQYVNAGYPLEGHIRFFIGYSGWEDGQLEGELRGNVWAVAPVSRPADLFTGAEDAFWHRQVRNMGECYRGWLYHPQNPRAN
nr:YqgE/AlgH family protein [Bacteroides sp.]